MFIFQNGSGLIELEKYVSGGNGYRVGLFLDSLFHLGYISSGNSDITILVSINSFVEKYGIFVFVVTGGYFTSFSTYVGIVFPGFDTVLMSISISVFGFRSSTSVSGSRI